MEKSVKEGKPFFVWHNPSRMHIYTHLREANKKLAAPHTSEMDIYGSGMMEHDAQVGEVLDLLDRLGIAENTIVIYTTDNGAMVSWFPDGGATPFRGEKATTWEGGVRVPLLVRWPARIPAGSVSNGIQSHEDLFTTLAAAAGAGDVVTGLRAEAGVCIDGVNNLAAWTEGAPSARNTLLYFNESELAAVRIGPWKTHMQVREGFFDYLRPSSEVFNLRMDPFERARAEDAMGYQRWYMERMFLIAPAAAYVGQWLQSFREFPPRQKPGSFNLDRAMEKVTSNVGNQ